MVGLGVVNATVQLVNERGRKYLTVDERQRFIRAAAHVRKPVDQTFVLTIAHTGARVSEILALRALDVDLDAGAVRIRTLKRSVEHWREVPVPPELARDLEMVHYLREVDRERGVAEHRQQHRPADVDAEQGAVPGRRAGAAGVGVCERGTGRGPEGADARLEDVVRRDVVAVGDVSRGLAPRRRPRRCTPRRRRSHKARARPLRGR